MINTLLVLNAGSSSIKFQLFSIENTAPALLYKGQIEGVGSASHFIVKDHSGVILHESRWESIFHGDGQSHACTKISTWLEQHRQDTKLVAAGHRVTHGGVNFSAPVHIDADVMTELKQLIPLAPLHQPHNIAGVCALDDAHPGLPQVACFDTMFHRRHPSVADRFAIPDTLYRNGIRRYGFHGLSYAYIAWQLRQIAPDVAAGRVVVAHLGNGASLCALSNGCSIDTTMSFSALDGLPMGTRCGALDPGVILYLLREKGMQPAELEKLLYQQSGLLGISGISNDLRDLIDSAEPLAAEAINFFVYRINAELAAMSAALCGLDALVFTAGIGENSALIRRRVCENAAWLGIELNPQANADNELLISSTASSVAVWVIPTDEELMIAKDTLRLVS